jgi:chemotaxis signal transduction protein
MSEGQSRLGDRAAALRLEFDRSFAEPLQLDTTPSEDLLAIRVGSEACAIRLSEIDGLLADKKITRVPGHATALLGIAGFRGAIMPVYNLAAFLGDPMGETPRWIAIMSGKPIALAFEAFEGHLRVPRTAILPQQAGEPARKYVREFVRMEKIVRPVLHLPFILEAIGKQRSKESP